MTRIERRFDPALSVAARKLFVEGLELEVYIGVYAHEHGVSQPLLIDVEIEIGLQPIETLADTLNYEHVVSSAQNLAAQGHIELVETFAEDLARRILSDPRALSVRVRAAKPKALKAAKAAGCEVTLRRPPG